MAALIVMDAKLGTAYTFNSAAANAQGFATGYLNCSGVLYAGGGITVSFPMINIEFVHLEPRLVTATNIFFTYDRTNTLLQMWDSLATTTAAGLNQTELASDTDIGSFTGLYFCVLGRD